MNRNLRKSAASRVACCAICIALALFAGAASASNDQYFSQQWGLQKIGAESAWTVARGAGVLIGVIDSGVQLNHPDLINKLVPGKDFIDGDNDPSDGEGHGTLVAGIAAAETGNGVGVAGTAPDAKILPVRAFDSAGNGGSDKVSLGIRWAVDEAARRGSRLVLNLSFVGPPGGGSTGGAIFADPSVRDAISYAAGHGDAVVAAAGNDGASATQYNAPEGSGIIVVGSSDQKDQCSSFTNYGSGLDILAPGTDILSTYNNGGYGRSSGTSMAAPFVSGALAVLMSNGRSASSAVSQLKATARGPAVSCHGESTSYGLLDLGAAVGAHPATGGAPAVSANKPRPALIPPSKAAAPPAPPPAPAPLLTIVLQPVSPPPEQPPATPSATTTLAAGSIKLRAAARHSSPRTGIKVATTLLFVLVVGTFAALQIRGSRDPKPRLQ